MKANSDNNPGEYTRSRNKLFYNFNITESEKMDESGETRAVFDYDYVEVKDTNESTAISALLSLLDIEKKLRLVAGFEVNGTLFDSDMPAEIRYMQLNTKFQSDPTYSTPWKAANNVWVTMDLVLYQSVIAVFETHISDIYTWLATEQAKL